MPDLLGTLLGQYRLTEVIRTGGMATVFKAYQASLDRYVAVKVLFHNQNPQFAGRFQREARAIAQLQHPNILSIYDYGEQDGLYYLVLQYIENGMTLADLLGRPLETEAALRLCLRLLEALDYAHQRGFVHRDVKPSNVLMPAPAWPVLADFGIAKLRNESDSPGLTAPGQIIGTAAYMAPEQVFGQPVDARTDLYSAGVVLYEMVTGQVPFTSDSPITVLVKQAYEAPPPARSLNPGLPESVEQVLARALAKNPAERYQSATEMGTAVYRIATEIERSRVSTPTTDLYEAAVAAFAEGRWDVAIARLRRLVADHPSYEDATKLLQAVRAAQEQAEREARATAAPLVAPAPSSAATPLAPPAAAPHSPAVGPAEPPAPAAGAPASPSVVPPGSTTSPPVPPARKPRRRPPAAVTPVAVPPVVGEIAPGAAPVVEEAGALLVAGEAPAAPVPAPPALLPADESRPRPAATPRAPRKAVSRPVPVPPPAPTPLAPAATVPPQVARAIVPGPPAVSPLAAATPGAVPGGVAAHAAASPPVAAQGAVPAPVARVSDGAAELVPAGRERRGAPLAWLSVGVVLAALLVGGLLALLAQGRPPADQPATAQAATGIARGAQATASAARAAQDAQAAQQATATAGAERALDAQQTALAQQTAAAQQTVDAVVALATDTAVALALAPTATLPPPPPTATAAAPDTTTPPPPPTATAVVAIAPPPAATPRPAAAVRPPSPTRRPATPVPTPRPTRPPPALAAPTLAPAPTPRPPPTSTPVRPPSPTPVRPPTSTPVPPALVPPTIPPPSPTPLRPPTSTPVPPTATHVPPTPVPPTATHVPAPPPPPATPVPPTPVPPTPVPPTPVPPTPVPPTEPPVNTPVPPTEPPPPTFARAVLSAAAPLAGGRRAP